MLLTVIVGFCFSKIATSSFHSLYCFGELVGGAQLMVMVTSPPPDELAALPLEQAAAASPRAVTATTLIAARQPARR